MGAAIAAVGAGGYADEHAFKANSAPYIAVLFIVDVFALSQYFLALSSIMYRTYYRSLTRALINTKKDSTGQEETRRRPVAGAIAKALFKSDPGRFVGTFVAGSEQFALYQIAVLRGGVEVSSVRRPGSAKTDGDLLPPRKLRLWSSGS